MIRDKKNYKKKKLGPKSQNIPQKPLENRFRKWKVYLPANLLTLHGKQKHTYCSIFHVDTAEHIKKKKDT